MTPSLISDEMPLEKPITPKTMNLEVDQEPEVNGEGENVALEEEKKTKKKDVKKEKPKRKLCFIIKGQTDPISSRRFLLYSVIYEQLSEMFQGWNRLRTSLKLTEKRRRGTKKSRKRTKSKNL